jgi:hypothetical protein
MIPETIVIRDQKMRATQATLILRTSWTHKMTTLTSNVHVMTVVSTLTILIMIQNILIQKILITRRTSHQTLRTNLRTTSLLIQREDHQEDHQGDHQENQNMMTLMINLSTVITILLRTLIQDTEMIQVILTVMFQLSQRIQNAEKILNFLIQMS